MRCSVLEHRSARERNRTALTFSVPACKKCHSSTIQLQFLVCMTRSRLLTPLVAITTGLALLTSCMTVTNPHNGNFPGNYNALAYKPKNPGEVKVKVSLQNRMIYVMEGDHPLLITPCTIGVPGKGTPTGGYRVTT